jgi:hypothetical protein
MDLKTLKDTGPWDWPEGADRMLLDYLGDEGADESDRIIAAQLAGDYAEIDDELVDALLSIVVNGREPEKLRTAAVISLGPILEHADTYGFDDPDDVIIAEQTFRKIQESLHALYMDADVSREVRRRVLEASVRAPQEWHGEAVRDAYASGDPDWILTAVFSMRWVRGFDDQILEALECEDEMVHYQAVCAAGNQEIDAAWPHIAYLISSETGDKALLLAAIEAVAAIRPQEAEDTLADLLDSEDEDIVDAVYEALALADALPEDEFDDEEEV